MSTKKIVINHVAKSEGHVGLEANIVNGNMAEAKMEVKEGARLIEGLLRGRKIEEVPEITARICGVCPTIHSLTAIKALESALKIKIPEPIIDLRKAMLYGQIIQSHTLHLFFLAISDYFGLDNSLDLAKLQPARIKDVIKIRDFANDLIEIIGGRATHSLSSIIGGFSKPPDKNKLKKLLKSQPEILSAGLNLVNLLAKIQLPKFSRPTEYVALKNKKEYPVYEGIINSTQGLFIPAQNYSRGLEEFQRPSEVVNLVKTHKHSYMVGALSRLNSSAKQLNPKARLAAKKLKIDLSSYNTFYNISGQMIEIIHFIEETKKVLERILKEKSKIYHVQYQPKAGEGMAACEAPRGLLIHHYKINAAGRVVTANVITPTAQFLFNLEEDLKQYIPTLKKMSEQERRRKIEMLVRAYDLCISCAVH